MYTINLQIRHIFLIDKIQVEVIYIRIHLKSYPFKDIYPPILTNEMEGF